MIIKRLLVAAFALALFGAGQVAPARATAYGPVGPAQLPAFANGECTTTIGSVVISCANMRAQPWTWTAVQSNVFANAYHVIQNTNDSGLGVFIGDTFGAGQLGMTNSTSSAIGNVPANNKLSVLAWDATGKVGSVTNTFTFGQPTYRNILDDGAGRGSFLNGLTGPTPAAGDNSTNVATTSFVRGVTSTLLPALFGAKCDGSTDDTTALQNEINAGAALGVSAVLSPRGATCITNQLLLKTNSHVRIDGTLKLLASANQNVLAANQATSNVVIEGDGTIDGNGSNQTGTLACIYNIGASSNWLIKDLTLINCRNFPINLVGGTSAPTAYSGQSHMMLSRLKILGGGNSTEFALGCVDCHADHLFISGTADYAFAFYGGCFDCSITNSELLNSAGGVVVLADGQSTGSTSTPSVNILIQGNYARGNNGPGYYVWNTAGTANHRDIRIIGNEGDHNVQAGNSNAANYGCVTLSNASFTTVSSNTCHEDGKAGDGVVDGVFINSVSDHITVNHNTIYNEGVGANGQGIFDGGAPDVILDGNTVFDTQGTKTTSYCINGSAGPSTVVVNNVCVPGSFLGTAYNMTNASDTVVMNNPGIPAVFPGNLTVNGNETIAGTLNVAGANGLSTTQASIYHLYGAAYVPTFSASTGTVSVPGTATDNNGTFSASAAATITVTFAGAFSRAPDCAVESPNGAKPTWTTAAGAAGAAKLTVTTPAAELVTYICNGL